MLLRSDGKFRPPRKISSLEFIKTPIVLLLAFCIFIQATPVFATFGDGSPTVPNADIFTEQNNNLRVDGASGAFTQRIPIAIPPGRNGLQPDVALEYNSQRTEDSIVGYGWSLSIPYIQRMSKTGSQDLYRADVSYISSVDGELVQVSTTTSVTHRARVDNGAFNAYSYSGNSWTMYDKKGTRYQFGSSDTGRQYDTATTSSKTYRWYLQEIRDTNGNYVTYTYLKDSNEMYPSQITYTNNGSTGPFAVTFATSTRTDTRESYKAGFKITTRNRISQITTSVSGTTVGTYALSYGVGANGTRSMLTSVQRTGYDESGTPTTLPAASFTYMSSTTPFYKPSLSGSYKLRGQAYLAADSNGNGIDDINRFYDQQDGSGLHAEIYADQTSYSNSTVPPQYWAVGTGPNEQGTRFMDVNGDGKPDLIRGYGDDFAGGATHSLYLNAYSTTTGSFAWNASTTYSGTIPSFAHRYVAGSPILTSGIFGEFNGDGLPDYSMSLPNYYTGTSTYLGNGAAWTATSSVFSAVHSMPETSSDTAQQLVDVNGDGLDDWVYSSGNSTYARLNNGYQWESSPSSQWTIPTSTLYYSTLGGSNYGYLDRGIRFMDINGDGLVDWVRSYYGPSVPVFPGVLPNEVGDIKHVFLNTGNGWATSTAYTLPYILQANIECSCAYPFQGNYTHDEYANWIGNGQMAQDVMTSITTSEGATKTITYTPSAQLGANPELPTSLLVVTAVADSDGFGTIATTTYSYSGGKFYLSDGVREKKFAGFSVSTTTAPDAVMGTYYHQGDGTTSVLGEQNDGYAQINRPYRTDVFDLLGNLIQRTLLRWDTTTATSSIFIAQGKEFAFDYDGNTTHKDRATTYSYATTTRELLSKVEYGEVSASMDGSFTDLASDKRTTSLTYVASSTVNLLLPRSKTVFDNTNATSSDERYYYDSLALGTVTKGNRTKVEQLKTGSTYINTMFGFNSYGLIASTTDPRNASTTFTYDARNLYVATSTNSLAQTTQFYYDYTLGKPKQSIDEAGRVFETVFDGLDRPVTEKQPDLTTPSTLVTKKTYAYTDTIGSRKVLETNYLDGSTDFTVHTYLDGYSRVIQSRKEAEDTDKYSVKDNLYNSAGLLARSSLPYFSSGSSRTTATANNALYASYGYDSLKRILTLATSLGTTTTAYDDWVATTTDPLGKYKALGYDAYKRLSFVNEVNSDSIYNTRYTYDASDNLTKVTDASANIRNFTYDLLKRRLTAEDLHNASDATFGTWTYVYDNTGNLATTTDPKGQVVGYLYDKLNRVTSEDYTGASGTEVTYAYDTCGSDGKGRLCYATSTAATTKFTYNALGLPATEQKVVGTTTYATAYSYNRQGNQTNIVYPDNSEVQYTYNTAGLLESVQQKESGGSFTDVVSDFDYGPHEKQIFKAFANGVKSEYTYDQNHLYRLQNIYTVASSTWQGTGTGGYFALLQSRFSNFAKALEAPLAFWRPYSFLAEAVDTLVEEPLTEPTVVLDEEPVLEPETEPAPVSEVPIQDVLTEEAVLEDIITNPELLHDNALLVPVEESFSVSERAVTRATSTVRFAPMRDTLIGKTSEEKATLKGQAVAGVTYRPRQTRNGFDIEVVSTHTIPGGVEAFVRAWHPNGEQIGFGLDGSVDTERFRIFNPPILVDDPEGEIVYTYFERTPGSKELVEKIRTLREDPEEALMQVIEHNLSVMGAIHTSENIVPGKKGNTTDTFYPDANPETTSFDGAVSTHDSGDTSWSGARNDTNGDYVNDSGTSVSDVGNGSAAGIHQYNGGTKFLITRAFLLFDTSAIGDSDVIGTTTLSVYGNNSGNTRGGSVAVATTTPASNTGLSNTDIDQVGLTKLNTSDISIASFSTSGYNNFSFNASGKNEISKTGVTKLGMREATFDIPNSSPSTGGDAHTFVTFYAADQTGTTNDPKLVVEHTTPNTAPTEPTSLLTYGQVNPTNASTTPYFSALYNEVDAIDYATHYQIQVATSTAFTNNYWDSSQTALASTTAPNTRSPNITYGGSSLVASTTYYWRVKFWDNGGLAGAWSTTTASFTTSSATTSPTSGNTHSLDFESSLSQYASVSDTASLSITGDITVEAWIKPEDFVDGTSYNIVAKGTTGGYNAWRMMAQWNSPKHYLVFAVDETGCNCVAVAYSYADVDLETYEGQWVHVAATWDADSGSATPKIYINGTEVGSYMTQGNDGGTNAIADTNSATRIGDSVNQTFYFDGKIDEVRLWNLVRTPTEIADNYAAELTGTESGLMAYWRLNNNGLDGTTNHNDLTLVNAPTYSTDVPFSTLDSESLNGIQNISYEYDAVGNITQLTDASATLNKHTVLYTYDDLYRLATASTTLATSTPYSHTYAYDPLGNITSMTGKGSYLYQGTTTGSYANPHAPTRINGVQYNYDRNGNLTNFASSTNSWDYRNRLAYAYGSSTPTVSYLYDHTTTRVAKKDGTATTTYPNKFYNISTSTSSIVKHIFTPDGELLATVKGTGTGVASTSREYMHLDHLGGVSAITSSTGTTTSVSSYYPYGSDRIATGNPDQRGYIAGEKNGNSEYYLINRYYASDRGQFTSQDPVFWQRQNLQNPQSFNSYSYAESNPIVKKDSDGLCATNNGVSLQACAGTLTGLAQGVGDIGLGAYSLVTTNPITSAENIYNGIVNIPNAISAYAAYQNDPSVSDFDKARAGARIAMGIAPFGLGGKAVSLSMKSAQLARQAEAVSFFKNTVYSDKVLSQMKLGDYHAFPEIVRNFADQGSVKSIVGKDKQTYSQLTIPGSYGGKQGVFEFIKDSKGVINHRQFNPSK